MRTTKKQKGGALRSSLQVPTEIVARLSDVGLKDLTLKLLRVQSHVCGARVDEVRVSGEIKAADDGCDAWSPAPARECSWLADSDTCWQLKSGKAGEPAKLRGEVLKPTPRATLEAGGRFVVIASGCTSSPKGERDRLKVLKSEATAAGIPSEKIDVIGADRLANWCNQYPAIAASLLGQPGGLWTFKDWERSPLHQGTWHGTPDREAVVAGLHQSLDPQSGSSRHVHFAGPPGVGKTRLALESCRGAPWVESVLYIRQASDYRLQELIDETTSQPDAILVVVADEVQQDDLLALSESVARGAGRIRLLTLGHSRSPDSSEILEVVVLPLSADKMKEVVSGWHPSMPKEHVDFVVRFADGYLRLARIAASYVSKEATVSVRDLLALHDIQGFLDTLLGETQRRALQVVAVLKAVGWEKEVAIEGKTIAEHLGLNWSDVRWEVAEADRKLAIAPPAGSYRYISPAPLGSYLAASAWNTFRDQMEALVDLLPSEGAKEAYYDRLRDIASNPNVNEFSRKELSFFFRIEAFHEERDVRRWVAMAAADPAFAAEAIRDALWRASIEEREQIAEGARRQAVWGLVRLATKAAAFQNAAAALALLAEAENESWSNNATGEFVARFQIILGGTSVPYPERLLVLDELTETHRSTLLAIVVKALAASSETHNSRVNVDSPTDGAVEPEWNPTTYAEVFDFQALALERLTRIARLADPALRTELIAAAKDFMMFLRKQRDREPYLPFFTAVREAYPEAQEELRLIVADLLRRERTYWRELGEQDLTLIEQLHESLRDESLLGRLRELVGQPWWDRDEEQDLTGLAEELLSDRNALEGSWPWLTSGEAGDGWKLGEALADADHDGDLEHYLIGIPNRGPDRRLLCGYVAARRRKQGDAWYDEWLRTEWQDGSLDFAMLAAITAYCGATMGAGSLVTEGLTQGDVAERDVGMLPHADWAQALDQPAAESMIKAIRDRGFGTIALMILARRLKQKPEEALEWDATAVPLLTDGHLVRGQDTATHWSDVAKLFVNSHARRIASAIFREQAAKKSGTWFAHYSDAGQMIHECVKVDAAGVWSELMPYLENPWEAHLFSIGFPAGVISAMRHEDVLAWIAQKPAERAATIAHFIDPDVWHEESLAAKILGEYGDVEGVRDAFYSQVVGGEWIGPASGHYAGVANGLQQALDKAKKPRLRKWLQGTIRSIRRMAEREKEKEEEEMVRRR